MSIKNWPGGRISSTPPTPSGPFQNSSASGVWTLDQVAYWKSQNQWPTAGNVDGDPFFENVTMLLHGDGTNGAQNNTFLDSSTNNFTVTRNGNATQGSFSPYGPNWSNFFDGNGDYLNNYSSTTPFAFGTGDFTVEAWVNFEATSGAQGIADSENTTGTNTQQDRWFFQKASGGNLEFGRHNVGVVASGTWAPAVGVWYHVAASRISATLRLFVNGIQVASASDSTNYLADGIQIGVAATPVWFNGYISNLRIVKGTALYTSNFTPSTTPLTAVSGTSILTCQSNRIVDNSTNNLTLTVNGNTSVQRFSPFSPPSAYSTATIGGSGYFDGSGDYLSLPSNSNLALGTGNFTIECWVYVTRTSNNYGRLFWFEINNTGTTGSGLSAEVYSDSGGSFNLNTGAGQTGANVDLGRGWHHIAAVRNSGVTILYVDGKATSSGLSDSTNYTASIGPIIGGGYYNGSIGNELLQGYLSNLRVLKGTALYTGNFTPPTAPVTAIANTQLLTNFTNGAIFDNAMMNDLETVGNAQISTSVVKFGTGSLYFDGTGDYLVSAPSPSNILGGGDFTLEFFAYPSNTSSGYRALVGSENYNAVAGGWTIYQNGTSIEVWLTGSQLINATSVLSASTWQHIALCRSGTTVRLFVNGSSVASPTDSQSWTGQRIFIGDNNVSGSDFFYNGYLDDMRITKGVARYTANFTPPTAAFPDI